MAKIKFGRRAWVSIFYARHPLLMAALAAAGGVLWADLNLAVGLVVSLVLSLVAGFFRGWRVGLGSLMVSWLALAVFTGRNHARDSAERDLLKFAGGEMVAWALRDGKGTERFWSAPVVLQNGPHPGACVWWEGRGILPVAGSQVKASGNFGSLPVRRNPGDFDQAAWLRNQGVAAIFHGSWVNGELITGSWAALGAQWRQGFRNAVTEGLADDSEPATVIRAVVIGEQPADADALVAAFRNSGTLHAFSVSGLHVAMVGSIGWLLLRWLGMSRRWAVWILLPFIFGYCWLTGNSPPAERSAWMAAVFLGAFVCRRRPDLLNALGAVLLAATVWDGRLLFQPGVQLSYGVVAAIALGANTMTRLFAGMVQPELYLPLALMTRWQKAWLKFRKSVAQSLGVSLAAGLGSTPLTAFHFGLITPISVFAGIILVPLVYILLSAALLAVALNPLLPMMTRWVNRANGVVAQACVLTAEGFAAIPGGHFQWRQDSQPFLLIYDLEHGAGAACFADAMGRAVLLDCGDRASFKRRVAPSLRRLGITPDSVILSHPDGGHLGGGAAVWQAFPIRQVLLPVVNARSMSFRAWIREAPAAGIKTLQVGDFQSLPLPDSARLEILFAPGRDSQSAAADDRVAIFKLHWRGWKLLFTSDAGLAAESRLLAEHADLAADLIIAGRHRGGPSLSDAFLKAVNPQAIIASHSAFPLAERLPLEAVKYWQSCGIQVIHQGATGGVTLRIDSTGNLCLEGFADQSRVILKPR